MAKKKTPKINTLDMTIKKILKDHGTVIKTAADCLGEKIETISSGSLSLDVALGRGGLALGRMYEISGPASGGKTTLAVNVIVQAQKKGLKCCFVDAEHAMDPVLFENYGVDLKELQYVNAHDGEANLDIVERLVQTGGYSVVVIDSVSALIPRAETEKSLHEDIMAPLARLMSRATRKISPIADKTNTLVIFINQLRNKIGAWGNPEVTTGGDALGFYATARIDVRGSEVKKNRLVDEEGEVFGHIAKFSVNKNKLHAPYRKAEIKLIYGKGFDMHWEVLDMAVSFGIVDKRGAWYYYNDESLAQGERNAVYTLKESEELYNEIRKKVIDTVGLNEYYE